MSGAESSTSRWGWQAKRSSTTPAYQTSCKTNPSRTGYGSTPGRSTLRRGLRRWDRDTGERGRLVGPAAPRLAHLPGAVTAGEHPIGRHPRHEQAAALNALHNRTPPGSRHISPPRWPGATDFYWRTRWARRLATLDHSMPPANAPTTVVTHNTTGYAHHGPYW